MRNSLKLALLLGALSLPRIAHSADRANIAAGFVLYSGMNFIELEREFVGLQIALISYDGGQRVLWRSAGPFLRQPILLLATATGKDLTIVVPDGDLYPGKWRLSLQGNLMTATGPNEVTFKLKRLETK